MTFLVSVSCGRTRQAEKQPSSIGSTSGSSYADSLEKKDFKGYSYRMLAHHYSGGPNFANSDEITGDSLQDAIFERKHKTMERLNIRIEEIPYDDREALADDAVRTILAGDGAYDVILTSMSAGINQLLVNGTLLDLTEIPYLTLGSERWNASMAEDMRIDGRQFFTTGVTSVCYLLTPQLVLFNQQLAEDNHLPDLYAAVRDHTWTLDLMTGLMKNIAIDLDGNGEMDPKTDRYALEAEGTFGNALYMAAGFDPVYPDEDGTWSIHIGDQASVDFIAKCNSVFSDRSTVYVDRRMDDSETYKGMFLEGRSLFVSSLVNMAIEFRSMENDFGVLPIPVLNEGDEYRIACNTWLPGGIAVPITASDTSRTGLIMETMAAYSYESILPAICEKTLGKTARDAESYQILEMVYQHTAFDFNTVMNFGETSTLLRYAIIGEDVQFTSTYRRTSKLAAKELTAFIDNCSKYR